VRRRAGTATVGEPFTYEGCTVPKLAGKKLGKAKKKLKKGHCKLGKVKLLGGATKKSGKVSKQSPKPGKVLAPGSKVSVKLSWIRGPRGSPPGPLRGSRGGTASRRPRRFLRDPRLRRA